MEAGTMEAGSENNQTDVQQTALENHHTEGSDAHRENDSSRGKGENGPEDNEPQQSETTEFEDVDFEALDFQSDYTKFMGENVPDFIQRKALRKLWSSNPLLANVDGLNDYDDDFTDAAMAVEAIQSAYKVGSGYLTEEEQVEYGMIEKEEDEPETGDAQEPIETAELGNGNQHEQEQQHDERTKGPTNDPLDDPLNEDVANTGDHETDEDTKQNT